MKTANITDLDPNVIEKAAYVLRTVAHPMRIKIINLLVQNKRLSVGEIQELLSITQSMTSQHLAALRSVEVVSFQKEANICYYYIVNMNVLKLLECVEKCVQGHN